MMSRLRLWAMRFEGGVQTLLQIVQCVCLLLRLLFQLLLNLCNLFSFLLLFFRFLILVELVDVLLVLF